MAVYARELSRTTRLFSDSTLIVAGNSVSSAFIRLPRRDITVTKVHTTGTYGLSIAWSNDGTNTVFTTVPTMVDNTPQTFVALAPYAKFTVSATGSTFTVHQTNVMA